MNARTIEIPRYTAQMLSGYRSNHEREIARWRERDIAAYLNPHRRLRILDLANGRLRPQYTLLKAAGQDVYGIDYINRPQRTPVDLAYSVARRLYSWRLGFSFNAANGQTLACGDVSALPFLDNWFDIVTSVAAFEHFLDVPSVVRELARVLRPNGIAWICVHLFTSPSGGHNLTFTEYPARSLPPGVDAWDHLRRRKLSFTVPLNKWRKDQYLAEFSRHFEILNHYCALREGEQWLTPEIQDELAGYNCDELTCATLVVVARKPGIGHKLSNID
jgi:SAM-dependent methyltransferase